SLANRIAGTPVTLVSLLDESAERVLAQHRWSVATIDSAHSFIPHLAQSGGSHLIIDDATSDERTRENPLVTGQPGIRFYGGFPLLTGDDLVIGALQVFDQKPRKLASQQLKALQSLATLSFRHLEEWQRIRALEEAQYAASDAKSALKESEERFRDLFESVDDIIMTILPNGGLVHMNRAGADHLAIPADRRPKTVFDLIHHEAMPEFREAFSRVVKQGEKESVETTFLTEFGKRVTVQGTLTPKVLDHSTVLVRVIFRDITERKKAELELGKARDAALDSARTKTRFLTNMSHELRTPMNVIIGMLELLLNEDLTDEQHDLASTAFASAESLLTTLSNILHVSQLESGSLAVAQSDFDPRSMLERLAQVTELLAMEQGCRLVVDIDPHLPLVLRGDATRVRQILTNLLSNAIKFNPGSEVTIRAKGMDETETHVIVRMEVSDNGSGIPHDVVPKLFTPFTQADDSLTREHQGAGLGLATAKQLVEMMGGVISVDTEEGEGSTFWFTLPFQRVTADSLALSARRKGFPGVRALIVDRSETSRKILEHYFSGWEIDSDFAETADQALEMLRQGSEGDRHYRLVLFDHRLSDRSGTEFAREIEADETLASIHQAMMVPLGYEINDSELRDAGIDAVVSKPVEQIDLFEKLSAMFAADILAEASGEEPPETAEASSDDGETAEPSIPDGLRILLAEDKVLNQKLTLSQLGQLGLTADVAANGSEVLEALEEKEYDVILMDCQMPIMDGYEATMKIREQEDSSQRVHIIALTAHAVEGERERCISAGMDDYLSKPTRQHQLASALGRIPVRP
ncbi:MAG: response regulator, partial [Thermoanaerobaculia bacterium]|nr:response regulator [Thermoanaerobaculia bacterium]